MLIQVLIGFSVLALSVVVFSVYETIKFNRYTNLNFGSSFNIPVNEDAPVISSDSIEIAAPVDSVWNVLTQINNWPEWQKNVTQARLSGEPDEGIHFKWKAGGLSFESQIHTIVPNKRFGWTGKTIGAMAIHNWTFDSKGNTTIVHVEESLQGVFPKIFKTYF